VANLKEFKGVDLILIASSTGGPVALETIFKELTKEIQIPILVVQHMPREFTNVLAQTLNKKCALTVEEAKEGEVISKGRILIAPGGVHMTVTSVGSLRKVHLRNSPYVNGVRPAADVLFKSIAQNYPGSRVLTVILTGMGSDGLAGVEELKKNCNCYCMTQSKDSCVVYGMPKSVFEAGLSDEIVELQDIAMRLKQLVLSRR
jgi:two-component system chemotaxis response regulator CheB